MTLQNFNFSISNNILFYKIEYFITSVIWLGKVIGENFLQRTLINFSSLYVQAMINNAVCHFPTKILFLSTQKH